MSNVIRFVLGAMLGAACMSSAAWAKPDRFDPNVDKDSVLIIVQQNDTPFTGYMDFREADLSLNRSGTRSGSNMTIELSVLKRLKTRNPALQSDISIALYNPKLSSFSVFKRPAGDFALYQFRSSSFMGTERLWHCKEEGAPVFRFKPGFAYLIPNQFIPRGHSIIDFERLRGTGNDVADAQAVLDEYPSLKAKVVAAEVVALIQYKKKNGELTGCRGGKEFVVVK